MTSSELIALIHERATASGIDPLLLQAICTIESSLKPEAIKYEPNYRWLWFPREVASRMSVQIPGYGVDTETALQRFSYGLPQLMGAVLREYGYAGSLHLLPTMPGVVLDYACQHLRRYMQKHPNEVDWISSWNQGSPAKTPGGLYRNQVYVDKVSAELRRLRALV